MHKHITVEAYYLLKNSGYNIPIMEGHLGSISADDNGTHPWQKSKITTGAYREDEEDVVFLHGWPIQTNNHFWDADNRTLGDFSLTHLHGIGYYKNAYEKASLFKNGNWYDQNNNPSWIIYNGGNNYFYYFMYKNGLPQFYKDNILWYEKKVYSLGGTIYKRYNIVIEDHIKHKICWEVLGRMCHLLQDMTVPAHAHGDAHWPESECYEDWTAISSNYKHYNRSTAGAFINPYHNSYGNPVRYLFYIANQLGDFWPSSPECNTEPPQWIGDTYRYNSTYGEGTYPILDDWYNTLGSPPNSVDPGAQANWNLNKAISLTASLLYWFAIEANLEVIHPVPTNFYLVNSPPTGSIIFNGQFSRTTAYATGNGVWFQWMQKRCDAPPPTGNWYGYNNPLHGIYYNIANENQNRFEIYNVSYGGQPCSDVMAVPIYTIYEKARACTNGGCTDFLQTFFGMGGTLPGGGCPFIFTSDGNPVFNLENNLLHKAEYEGSGEDITDRYLLTGNPLLQEDADGNPKLNLVIKELNDAVNSFDYIRLLRVLHPYEKKIGVTENNQIVRFDSLQVISSEYASLNGYDITENIQYGREGSYLVSGLANDQMHIQYPPNFLNNPSIILEIGGHDHIIYPNPAKDYAGHITINLSDGSIYETNFSRRENMSLVVIEIPVNGDNVSIVNSSIVFYRDFKIKFIALADLTSEREIIITELPLHVVKFTNDLFSYNLENELYSKDYNYLTLDSTDNQTLHVQFNYIEYDPVLKADYILEINGNYQSSGRKILGNLNNQQKLKNFPRLFSNYPNPFNPVTKIKFELPFKQDVELKIFNVLGQEITTLFGGILNNGYHEFTFDGTNYASGIYFYQIVTHDYIETKKMLLIK